MINLKILFHAINGVGLGHLNRTLILAKGLKVLDCDTRIITNAKFTKYLDGEGIKYYKLPHAIYGDKFGKNIILMKKENKKFMKSVIEGFNPDTMVYDTYPFYEILNDKCSKNRTNILILRKLKDEFLRKLLDDPIMNKFQLVILPHTLEEFEKSGVSKDIMDRLSSEKFVFTGPLVKDIKIENINKIKKRYGIKGNKFNILATAGGGGTDQKYNLGVDSFFGMVKSMSYMLGSKIKNLNLIIIKGPYYENDINAKNATVKKFELNLMELISAVDLVISTAGYNITNEICKTKTPAIMVPLPRHAESQHERIANLENIGAVIGLIEHDPIMLSKIVFDLYKNREKIKKMRGSFEKIKFYTGNERAINEIAKIRQKDIWLYNHEAKRHNKIAGIGSFERTLAEIHNLSKLKLSFLVRVIVNEENYIELEKITRFLAKLKVKEIQFVFLDKHPPLDKVFPHLLAVIDFAEKKGININFNKYGRLIGVATGRLFSGPEIVQINPINACNYNCIYCWNYSQLLMWKKSKKWKGKKIDFEFFKHIVDDAARLGTDMIALPGNGEPFMHPKIIDMIKYVKMRGLKLSILTNASLMTKKIIKRIIELGVDYILINISATSSEAYIKMHPNQRKESFNEIKSNLIYLNEMKKKNKTKKPYVNIVNIITNINYRDMPTMCEFAKKIGADFVSFKPVSTLEGTDSLLLSGNQVKEAVNYAINLLIKMKKEKIRNNLENFIKLVTEGGPSGYYTEDLIKGVGCFATWYYWRIVDDKMFSPCCQAPVYIKIGKKNFINIWNSEQYKIFRNKINVMNRKGKLAYEECKICEHFKKNVEILEDLKKHNLLQFLK